MLYWRQYATFAELGLEFGVAESTAHDIVKWVEKILIKQKEFHIPGKQALLNDSDIDVVLVDATETAVERPKKSKKMVLWKKISHYKATCFSQYQEKSTYKREKSK